MLLVVSATVIHVACTPLPVPSDFIKTLSVPSADAAVTSQDQASLSSNQSSDQFTTTLFQELPV